MKKLFLLYILTLFFNTTLNAFYLKNVPQKLKQPNGTVLNCYATGDEFYSWLHDINGYTIIKNTKTGYWVYARLENDELIPTSLIPTLHNPTSKGLTPWINISKEKMQTKYLDSEVTLSLNKFGEKRSGTVKGVINNIVIFIKFNDENNFTKNIQFFDTLYNDSTMNSPSLHSYYKEVSHAKFTVNSFFYPKSQNKGTLLFYQDEYSREYYQPYDSISNPIGYSAQDRMFREHQLLQNALKSIETNIPSELKLDYNEDGLIDNVSFILQGSPDGWNSLLWPHRWLVPNGVTVAGYKFQDYNLLLENSTDVSVLCHEFFHTLGAPDLYHGNQDGLEPVGIWDIMATTTKVPQYMNSMSKYLYAGWIDDLAQITHNGVYTLNPSSSSKNNIYTYQVPNTNEYLIFEYRKKEGLYESNLPGSGLLIYRYNLSLNGNISGPPDGVYVYRPNGDSKNNGDIKNATFSKETGRTQMNINTLSKPYLSNDSLLNIDIYNVTEADNTISFTIGITDSLAANFETNKSHYCTNTPIQLIDKSIGSPVAWNWSFPGGNPSKSNEQNPIISYTNNGNYSIELTIKNNKGIEKTIKKTNYISIDSFTINLPQKLIVACGINNTISGEVCNASNTDIQYDWSPKTGLSNYNALSPIVNTTNDQTYVLTATKGTIAIRDTIHIFVDKPKITDLPDSVSILYGDSILLRFNTNIDSRKYIYTNQNDSKKINFSVGDFGPQIIKNIFKDPIKYQKDISNQFNGCNSYPDNSFINKTALINRGSCFFSTKAFNAQIAGASGVIIIDSIPHNGNFLQSFTGNLYASDITIPVVLINYEDGAYLKQLLDNLNDVNIKVGSDEDAVMVVCEDTFETNRLSKYQFISSPKKSKYIKFRVSTFSGCGTIDSIYFHVETKSPLTITSIDVKNLEIYPIPANDYIIIKTDNSENKYVEIYSISGVKKTSEKITNENHKISTSSWSKGIYLVKVINNRDVQIKTIVID